MPGRYFPESNWRISKTVNLHETINRTCHLERYHGQLGKVEGHPQGNKPKAEKFSDLNHKEVEKVYINYSIQTGF